MVLRGVAIDPLAAKVMTRDAKPVVQDVQGVAGPVLLPVLDVHRAAPAAADSASTIAAGVQGATAEHADSSPLALTEVLDNCLREWLAQRGESPMRLRQLRHHLYRRGCIDYDQMTDLPRPLRQKLAAAFPLLATTVEHRAVAADGTHKLLVRLKDRRSVECVLIQDGGRATACISTQVGCGMGCVFCASGLSGVERNLTPPEIVEQLLHLWHSGQRRPTHIVVMGMGEPLANLDNLLQALAIACDPKAGMGISQRHVTISTVGLPKRIRQLAASGTHYHLAVSLHAPNDELRTRLVPTNAKTGIAAIVAAADEFFRLTGRQVTYEYVLLGGVNDDARCARELAQLLRGRKAHVNLIPWNPVAGLPFRRPTDAAIQHIVFTLRQAGISVKVRKRKGAEIDAACGQLRRRLLAASNPLPPETERVGIPVDAADP